MTTWSDRDDEEDRQGTPWWKALLISFVIGSVAGFVVLGIVWLAK